MPRKTYLTLLTLPFLLVYLARYFPPREPAAWMNWASIGLGALVLSGMVALFFLERQVRAPGADLKGTDPGEQLLPVGVSVCLFPAFTAMPLAFFGLSLHQFYAYEVLSLAGIAFWGYRHRAGFVRK